MSDSRRHRQQLSTEGDRVPLREEELESLEVVDEALELDCRGSAPGRWAAEVWSCRRREASAGLDMDFCGGWRRASSGLVGSA